VGPAGALPLPVFGNAIKGPLISPFPRAPSRLISAQKRASYMTRAEPGCPLRWVGDAYALPAPNFLRPKPDLLPAKGVVLPSQAGSTPASHQPWRWSAFTGSLQSNRAFNRDPLKLNGVAPWWPALPPHRRLERTRRGPGCCCCCCCWVGFSNMIKGTKAEGDERTEETNKTPENVISSTCPLSFKTRCRHVHPLSRTPGYETSNTPDRRRRRTTAAAVRHARGGAQPAE
jgi:hypothetical protein